MAEERDWTQPLLDLLSVFSPGEAEAEVVAKDWQSKQLIDAIASGNPISHVPPERQQLYQEVLRRAESRPETVSVGYDVPWKQLPQAVGFYEPQKQSISMRDVSSPMKVPGLFGKGTLSLPAVPKAYRNPYYGDTLTHEFLHFLLPLVGKDIEQKRPDLQAAVRNTISGDTPDRETLLQHILINFLHGQDQERPGWSSFNTRPLFQGGLNVGMLPQGWPKELEVYDEAMRVLIQNPALLKQALAGIEAERRRYLQPSVVPEGQ